MENVMQQESCESAARHFVRWAARAGLMDSTLGKLEDGEATAVTPVTDAGIGILRARQIVHVAFDGANHTVYVILRKVAPPKKFLALVPSHVFGYPILYRQGINEPIGVAPVAQSGAPWSIRNVANIGRYTCGSSISVGNAREAGTLGCLVRQADGALFGLSNNHVSGSCSYAQTGLPIVAPGILDVMAGGLDPFTIGRHSSSLSMRPGDPSVVPPSDNCDAAIFEITNPDVVSSFQGNIYDTPSMVGELTPGQIVEKVGRTTSHTTGKVHSQLIGPCPIQYKAEQYEFHAAVYFDPMYLLIGDGDLFSDSGDSGSLICSTDDQGNRMAVGIVVGGAQANWAPGNKVTLALPIKPVLERLGVSIVSGHNST